MRPRPQEPAATIDLHGRSPDAAMRFLLQELHAARVRRLDRVLVVTGRGWGNLEQKARLRPRVEAWLRGPEARRLGVSGFEVTHKGGALDVRLGSAHPDRERHA